MQFDTANAIKYNELQTTFMWEVNLPKVFNGPDANFVSQFANEVSFSGYNMNEIFEQKLGPADMHSAGVPSIPTVTIGFLSTADGAVVKYFDAWRDLIFDTGNKWYYAKDNYALPIYCTLYNRNGEKSLRFSLKNAFPKTFPKHDLSYVTEAFVDFKVEFSIDALVIE